MQPGEDKAGWFRSIMYPTNRQMIRNMAERNGAPQDILEKIDKFDDQKTFRGYSDIMYELGFEGYVPVSEERPDYVGKGHEAFELSKDKQASPDRRTGPKAG